MNKNDVKIGDTFFDCKIINITNNGKSENMIYELECPVCHTIYKSTLKNLSRRKCNFCHKCNGVKTSLIGKEYICKNGEHCVLVQKDGNKVLVRFEHGEIKECSFTNVERGTVVSEKYKLQNYRKHIGEIHKTTEGYDVKIIDRNANSEKNEYVVKFLYNGYTTTVQQYETIKNGNIKNPYHKSVVGVGYLGDTTCSLGGSKQKYSYKVWKHMLERCYSPKDKEFNLYGGEGCIVCEEWHCYANFEKWFDEHYYSYNGTLVIDKDIFSNDTKIYSPETCCIIPKEYNGLFRDNRNQSLPYGVKLDKKRYRLSIKLNETKTKEIRSDNLHPLISASKYYRTIKRINCLKKYQDVIPKQLYDKILNKLNEYIKELNYAE